MSHAMSVVSRSSRPSVRRRLAAMVVGAMLVVSCSSTEPGPEPLTEFRLAGVNGTPLPVVLNTAPDGDVLLTDVRITRGGALERNELGIRFIVRRDGRDFEQSATLIGRRAGLVTEYGPGPCNDTFLAAACIYVPTLRSTAGPVNGTWRLLGADFFSSRDAVLDFVADGVVD